MLLQHSLMDVYAPYKKMEPSRLLLQEGINQPAPKTSPDASNLRSTR